MTGYSSNSSSNELDSFLDSINKASYIVRGLEINPELKRKLNENLADNVHDIINYQFSRLEDAFYSDYKNNPVASGASDDPDDMDGGVYLPSPPAAA
jgi:hypothetical protein